MKIWSIEDELKGLQIPISKVIVINIMHFKLFCLLSTRQKDIKIEL